MIINLLMFLIIITGFQVSVNFIAKKLYNFNCMRIYKLLGDRGYKMNLARMNEIDNECIKSNEEYSQKNNQMPDENFIKKALLDFFGPECRLASVITDIQKVNNFKNEIVNNLVDAGGVFNMTEEEKAIYDTNPTASTGYEIAREYNERRSAKEKKLIFNGNVKGTIYFIFENNGCTITKSEGPIASLPQFKQQILLEITLARMSISLKNRITREEVNEMSKEGKVNLNLNNMPEREELIEPDDEMTPEKRKQYLKELSEYYEFQDEPKQLGKKYKNRTH